MWWELHVLPQQAGQMCSGGFFLSLQAACTRGSTDSLSSIREERKHEKQRSLSSRRNLTLFIFFLI